MNPIPVIKDSKRSKNKYIYNSLKKSDISSPFLILNLDLCVAIKKPMLLLDCRQ